MPVTQEGAQRASRQRSFRPWRVAFIATLAAALAVGGLAAHPETAAAAGKKVVIVVGPVGSQTANYIYNAKKLAAQARSYGARVYEVYSPHATWAKVKSVAQGANVFIYLGHGNGYPSPYGAFSKYTKDGLGLNATDGSTKHKYYGEYYVDRYLNFAPNAVVILNRLCYASGNSEPGMSLPEQVDRDQARRQLRGRLPPDRGAGGLCRGHRERVVHPVRAVQDESDDVPDLLVRPDPEWRSRLQVLVRPDARPDRDPRSQVGRALLPIRRGHLGMTAATWRAAGG